jgi:hypothetical protein
MLGECPECITFSVHSVLVSCTSPGLSKWGQLEDIQAPGGKGPLHSGLAGEELVHVGSLADLKERNANVNEM